MRVPIRQHTTIEAKLRRGQAVWIIAEERLTKAVVEEAIPDSQNEYSLWVLHNQHYITRRYSDIRTLPWQWPIWRWKVCVVTDDMTEHKLLAEGPTTRDLLYVGDDPRFRNRRFVPRLDNYATWRRKYDTKPPIPYEWAYRVSDRFTQQEAKNWHRNHRVGR